MHDVLGYIAAILTTLAFLPQVTKIYKERSARSISSKTFLMFAAGVFCWLLYGIAVRSAPMILSNLIILALSITILVLKQIYRENDSKHDRRRP